VGSKGSRDNNSNGVVARRAGSKAGRVKDRDAHKDSKSNSRMEGWHQFQIFVIF